MLRWLRDLLYPEPDPESWSGFREPGWRSVALFLAAVGALVLVLNATGH